MCLLYIAAVTSWNRWVGTRTVALEQPDQAAAVMTPILLDRGCVLCFLTAAVLFPPRRALNVEAKVVGKLIKVDRTEKLELKCLTGGRFIFQERAPEMMQISKCQHMLKKRAPTRAGFTAVTMETLHPGRPLQVLKGSIFRGVPERSTKVSV